MTTKSCLLGIILGFLLLFVPGYSAEEMTLQIHLFKGVWAEGHPAPKEVTVMTAASHPAIEALKANIGGPEAALKTAAVTVLMDTFELRTVDHILSFSKLWSGRDIRLAEIETLGRTTFFFNFDTKRLSTQKYALATSVFISKALGEARPADDRLTKEVLDLLAAGKLSARMEKLLDLGLEIEMGDPAIVTIPTEDGVYFMLTILTAGTKTASQVEFAGGPKVLHKVIPSYPEELRRQGIEGHVELQVGIDPEGNVGGVRILKSVHPYLDNSAVQALKQWKFEPVRQNGEPVPAVITLTVNFTREAYRQVAETPIEGQVQRTGRKAASKAELSGILERCAAYCDRLKGAALDYICEETVRDVYFNLPTEEEQKKNPIVITLVSRLDGSVSQLGISSLPLPNPHRTERNKYVCDYLFIKKGGGIQDKRIILEENGRKSPDRSKTLEERRFTTLTPLLAPVRLLGRDRQPLFDYRILKSETIKRRPTVVIEVMPKPGNAAGVEHAKVWVEMKSSQILKVEITGLPFEGYESVLKELVQYNAKAKFIATYSYLVEKKGLSFPSEAKIRVSYAYPGISPEAYYIEKIRTDMKYDKYKFFIVETDGAVKK